jgi:hypothetical protein
VPPEAVRPARSVRFLVLDFQRFPLEVAGPVLIFLLRVPCPHHKVLRRRRFSSTLSGYSCLLLPPVFCFQPVKIGLVLEPSVLRLKFF